MAASTQDQNLGQLASATQVQAEQEQFRANNNLPAASGKNLAADVIRTSGNSMTGPNVQPANMTNQERAMARANGAMVNAYKPDTNKYNKLTSFNASHHGRNFDRFYSHPKFKELGFSPWRDNEAFYNKNSSLWDDAVRGGLAGTKLMGLGFTSTFTNWGSLFSLKPNIEEADEMERLMSIGSSSREGFGAKVVNFGVNAGYTFGTVSEIIAEELALAAATVLTAGGAAPAAGIRTAMNVGRLGKAAKGLYDTFKVASKIDNARQVWNASKGLKTLGKAAEYIMPFQNTMGVVKKGLKAGDTLGDMAKSSKTFGAFYRDLREINAVTSEAKLEGGTTQNDVTNQLYAKFRTENKRDPNEQEAQSIFNQAREAGYLSSQMNAAGIYASNKIVLNRLLKGVPGMGELDKVARRKVKGTILFDANWAKLGKNPYEAVKGMKKFGKAAYYKQTFNPKNLAKGGLGYLSANLMEGVQEVYQESIAKGISDYYVNTYNQPSRASSAEFYTKMKEGFKSQYSAQGLETFFSGFLMAGPISGAQTALFKGFDYARLAKLKTQSKAFAADPKNEGKENPFDTQLKEEEEYTNKVVNSLNEITKEPKKYFSALEQNIKVQADLARLGEQAALDGDTMAVKNTQDESLINHMITLLDAGKFDIFQDQLKGLQELDKADLQEAFDEDPNTTGKTVSDRISKVIERTNQIKDTYDQYSTIENQYDLRSDPIGYSAFEQARNIAIRNDVTFQRQGERIAGIMNEFSSNLPFENARASDFTVLFSIGDPKNPNFLQATGMRTEIALLEQEMLNLKQGTPEQQEQAKRLEEKKTSLQSLSSLTQAFNAAYTVTQSVGITAEEFETKNSDFEEVESKFKKAFFDHIKILAKETGKPVLDSQIEKSYEEFSDYWKLTADREGTAAAINMLNTPAMFRESTERIKGAMEEANQRREENLKKALSEYKLKFLKNAFFNDLFEQFNAFVDPDEAQAYVDNQTIPTTFINADTLDFIKPTDPEYSGIMGLVDKYDELYFDETGNRLTRPIVGSAGVARFAGRSAEGEVVDQIYTRRDPSDKRTIKDLGTEFGFAHLQNVSEVDAVAVLTAIMKSANGFVPAAQKKLAQALLKLIKPGTKITFKNNHFTNSSYDPSNGIIIDARFSSEGFVGGTVPMEFSILNAVMQQVVTESLATDAAFNDNITALREQTKAVIGETENMLPYYAYALANNQQFIAEVMTNPEFKGIMGQIPFEGEMTEQTEEAKSLWGSFVDSVYKLIEKLFGLQRGKTLYQEALNVITNKLSQPGMGSATPETFTEEEVAPVEEVTDPELDQLLKSKFNEIIDALTPEERLGISYDSWKQSDSTALGIIRKYKADKVRKAAATKSEDEDKIMTLAEKKKRFTSLGYTIVEMNNMPEDEVTDIIAKGIKKTITIDVVENGKTVSKEIPFDQLLKFGDHVERSIGDAIVTLGAKRMKLNADESAYVKYDALDQEIPGTEHERVTNVVKDPFAGPDEAKHRGNIIDGLLRDFLLNKITDINQFVEQYNKYKAANPKADLFGPTMLEELYDKMRTISLVIKQKGLKIKSDVPTLAGKIGSRKAAGTIDLLAYDGKGRVFIIDLKTSSQDRRLQYKLEETLEKEFGKDYKIVKEAIKGHEKNIYAAIDTLSEPLKSKLKEISQRPEFAEAIKPKGMFLYFYKEADSLQQNAYRELLRQETGLVADQLIIFPLLTTKTRRTYTSVSFQKEGDTHTLRIPIIDIHKRLGVDNEVLNYPDNPLSPENLAEFTEEPVTDTPEPVVTDAIKAVEARRQEALSNIISEESTEENRRPNGSIGTQGFDPTQMKDLIKFLNKKLNLSIDEELFEGDKIKPLIDFIKDNKDSVEKIKQYVKTDPIEVSRMPDGSLSFRDGNHRANLLNLIGSDILPTIEVGQRGEIDKINAEYDAELVAEYRAQEIAEFRKDVENAESFIVNGRIDSKKVKASSNAKAKEIYDRYDKLITPLLPAAPVSEIEAKKADIKALIAEIEPKRKIAKTESKTEGFLYTLQSPGMVVTKNLFGKVEKVTGVLIDANIPNDERAVVFSILADSLGEYYGKVDDYYNAALKKLEEELAALEGKPTDSAGTQTELEFEELIIKVGDRVKVNTRKDGEGIVEEDLGDRVRLQDGRRPLKKNLTKLDTEVPVEESEVADKFKGKIIYTTPTNDSTKKLNNIPGLVYGNSVYTSVVFDAFTEEIIQKIQTIADDKTLKPDVIEAAQKILNFVKSGIRNDQVGDLNRALAVLSDSSNYKDARLGVVIRSIRQNAWKQTMSKAREIANSGKTVIFDNQDAARSPEIDIALIDANINADGMTTTGKSNVLKVEGQIPRAKVRIITDKGLVNVVKGSISEDYYISSDIKNFKSTLSTATRKTIDSMRIEFKNPALLSILESIFAEQGLTIEEARSLFAQKEAELKNKVDISDLAVDPNNPTIVTYISGEEMSTGVVILNDGMTVTIAKYSGNETFNDLLNNAEHTTFTAGSIPNVIVPFKTQAAVSVDISVKNQSDNIMNDAKDNVPSSADTLKKAIEANKDKSVSEVVNNFISNINCNK